MILSLTLLLQIHYNISHMRADWRRHPHLYLNLLQIPSNIMMEVPIVLLQMTSVILQAT
jgi:hypothetical protein